jgi:hypothetical protein
MKAELEFHDSTLATMAVEEGDIVVHFRPAYVRADEGGVVSGYEQDVDIRFVRARALSRPGKMPVWIAEGTLKTKGGKIFEGLMPVPCLVEEEVSFFGVTAESEVYQIEAAGCSVALVSKRRFIEKIT